MPTYGEVVEAQSEDGLRSMGKDFDSRLVSGENEEEKRPCSELNLTENDSSKCFSSWNIIFHKYHTYSLLPTAFLILSSIPGEGDDDWDKRSIRSIRNFVSQGITTSQNDVTTPLSEIDDNFSKLMDKEEKKNEASDRFW